MNNDTNSNEENNSKENIKITISPSSNTFHIKEEKDPFIPAQVEQYLSVITCII